MGGAPSEEGAPPMCRAGVRACGRAVQDTHWVEGDSVESAIPLTRSSTEPP
jgi:hypothetical protein